MNLTESKKTLALSGAALGIVAAALAFFGNPKNMAICIACFIRDTAGAMKLHQAALVQYVRPEIVGIVVGAFFISLITKEYRSTAGSSPMIRFVLGMIMMIGALVFLGCPLRMLIRMSAGDLNAYVALIGFVGGVFTGTAALKKGFKKRQRIRSAGPFGYRTDLERDDDPDGSQREGAGKYARAGSHCTRGRAGIRSGLTEMPDLLCRKLSRCDFNEKL